MKFQIIFPSTKIYGFKNSLFKKYLFIYLFILTKSFHNIYIFKKQRNFKRLLIRPMIDKLKTIT